jgi:hypothetical protein
MFLTAILEMEPRSCEVHQYRIRKCRTFCAFSLLVFLTDIGLVRLLTHQAPRHYPYENIFESASNTARHNVV